MWWCGAVVGEGGGGDDVHATATCVFLFLLLNFFCPYWSQSFWWSFQDTCCLAFHTSTMQKPRVFAAFQTKTSKMTLNLNLKKHEKHGICDTFAKIKDTPRAAADARATLLLLLCLLCVLCLWLQWWGCGCGSCCCCCCDCCCWCWWWCFWYCWCCSFCCACCGCGG